MRRQSAKTLIIMEAIPQLVFIFVTTYNVKTDEIMLQAGNYHTLTVSRYSDHGIYLSDDEGNEVLLPNRYTSLEDRKGDLKRVFIYHDSDNRLIATTETPAAVAGEAAYLKVVDKNIHGAFLEWGITAKDLFLPNSNQTFSLTIGNKYIVFLYRDNISGRVVASTKLNAFISNSNITVRPREKVDILVSRRLEKGFRVIVNNRNWGMIYDNQIFSPVSIGDRLTGYVSRITDDNRIDISLQQQGFDQVRSSADKLLDLVILNGGSLPLNDKSSPEEVAATTGMSKKVFKRSLGYLLSRGAVELHNDSFIKLKKTSQSK